MRALVCVAVLALSAQAPILLQPGITPPRVLKHAAPDYPVNASQLRHERSVAFYLASIATDLESLQALSSANFPPAQFTEVVWRIVGNKFPANPAAVGQAGI